MEIVVHPGSSRVLKFLSGILLLIGIYTGYQKLVQDDGVATAMPTPILANTRTALQPGVNNSQPAVNNASTTGFMGTDDIILQPLVPESGQVVKNPALFKWQASTSVYYAVEIRHTEAGKSYRTTSPWTLGNFVELNLPNEAIGNLEWRLIATTSLADKEFAQSGWRHFTFDPFYENKERQDGSDG